MTRSGSEHDLVVAVLGFSRRLRLAGLPADPERARQAAAALTCVDVLDPAEFYYTLRAAMVNSPSQIPTFNRLYAAFWRWPNGRGTMGLQQGGAVADPARAAMADDEHSAESEWAEVTPASSRAIAGDAPPAAVGSGTAGSRDPVMPDGHSEPLPGGYLNATLWSGTPAADSIVRLVSQIVGCLSLRPGRRYRAARRGQRWDLRGTMRAAVRFGGRPLRLPRRTRKRQTPRVVLLCDVSHSMEAHSVFVLQVVHSFHHQRARIESFVFSTELRRVTPYLRRWNLAYAVRRIVADFPQWSGSTRIGECLATFEQRYARQVLNRRTALILVTDGITVGNVPLVRRTLEHLASRAGAVFWLNPLLGAAHYAPEGTSVGAAVECIDVVAPVRDVPTLNGLVHLLRGRKVGRRGSVR